VNKKWSSVYSKSWIQGISGVTFVCQTWRCNTATASQLVATTWYVMHRDLSNGVDHEVSDLSIAHSVCCRGAAICTQEILAGERERGVNGRVYDHIRWSATATHPSPVAVTKAQTETFRPQQLFVDAVILNNATKLPEYYSVSSKGSKYTCWLFTNFHSLCFRGRASGKPSPFNSDFCHNYQQEAQLLLW